MIWMWRVETRIKRLRVEWLWWLCPPTLFPSKEGEWAWRACSVSEHCPPWRGAPPGAGRCGWAPQPPASPSEPQGPSRSWWWWRCGFCRAWRSAGSPPACKPHPLALDSSPALARRVCWRGEGLKVTSRALRPLQIFQPRNYWETFVQIPSCLPAREVWMSPN